MSLVNALEIAETIPELIDCIDLLVYHRPVPRREYDQIYMNARSMLWQANHIWESLAGRKIAFLGDGDGISLLLASLFSKYSLETPQMTVLDFDERILCSLKELQTFQNLSCPISYCLYNIINPIDSQLCDKFDYFLINPPYGSKNDGLSCIMWLHRCMDLCTSNAEGCIIVPYDEAFPWTIKGATEIFNFLTIFGFEVSDMQRNVHSYHLRDNPSLKSSMIMVKRIKDIESPFKEQQFPFDMCRHLYGSPRAIPQYIKMDQKNPLGHLDFNWEYGKIENFLPRKSI